jgi:hypothetical protein
VITANVRQSVRRIPTHVGTNEESEGVPGRGREKAALMEGNKCRIPKYEPFCMV